MDDESKGDSEGGFDGEGALEVGGPVEATLHMTPPSGQLGDPAEEKPEDVVGGRNAGILHADARGGEELGLAVGGQPACRLRPQEEGLGTPLGQLCLGGHR